MNAIKKYRERVNKYGRKYVWKVILRNKIYRSLDLLITNIGSILFKSYPIEDAIILESHNDFDSNGGAFYNYLLSEGINRKYKIIWLLRNKTPKNLPKNVIGFNIFVPCIRKTYYLCTAKYILFCHEKIEKYKQNQLSVYMTHGPVGLKSFKGSVILPKNLDYCLMPSEQLEPILSSEYMIEKSNIKTIILGYPIHDYLYTEEKGDLYKITKRSFKKVILWMPTFRKAVGFQRNDSSKNYPLGIPLIESMEEFENLNRFLSDNNSLIVIKIHPMQDLSSVKIHDLSNIIILDGNQVKKLDVDNYRLMKDTDALISDYSSSAYDYLHLDKPIAYSLDDVASYSKGLLFDDIDPFLGGEKIFTYDDLIRFIFDVVNNKDNYVEKRHAVFDVTFKYHDGKSSERLAKFLGLKN